jgi:hypothetical protein
MGRRRPPPPPHNLAPRHNLSPTSSKEHFVHDWKALTGLPVSRRFDSDSQLPGTIAQRFGRELRPRFVKETV